VVISSKPLSVARTPRVSIEQADLNDTFEFLKSLGEGWLAYSQGSGRLQDAAMRIDRIRDP